VRCRCLEGEHLSSARPRHFGNFVHAAPFGGDDVQRFLRFAAQHAGETAAVDRYSLQHFTAFVDTQAALVGNIGVPDGIIGIDAYAVRDAISEVSPHAAIRKGSVGGDGESGSFFPWDSATIKVELSGVIAMPLGKAMPSATCRSEPSEVSTVIPVPPLM